MNRRREGFTLLELIVVITIIGIMGTFVVVKVGGMTYKAKAAKIRSDLKAIRSAADAIHSQTGDWPQDIQECVKPPTEEDVAMTLKEYPKDPWGREYGYDPQGADGEPLVFCLGKDESEGGEDENQDYYEPRQQE